MFGKSAGETVVEDFQSGQLKLKPLPADAADFSLSRIARLEGQANGESVFDVGAEMRRTMQKHAGVFRFDDKEGFMYLDTCHPGKTPEEIKEMCQFDLDISRVAGETKVPTREELRIIHEVLDPSEIFLPKVKKA